MFIVMAASVKFLVKRGGGDRRPTTIIRGIELVIIIEINKLLAIFNFFPKNLCKFDANIMFPPNEKQFTTKIMTRLTVKLRQFNFKFVEPTSLELGEESAVVDRKD